MGRASFHELAMLFFLLRELVKNLMEFGIPDIGSLQEEVVKLARQAREVLEIEDLAFVENAPSIEPFLRFFSEQPSIIAYVEAVVKRLKMIWWSGSFYPSFEEHFSKIGKEMARANISLLDNESDMLTLEIHIGQTEALLILAREEMRDSSSSKLE
ncbi:hypothetical protein AMTR_s00060p00189170 [Amborella trichopoda]|uniref:Uncharacterized protein n=1 Tax=Amborella trichopoda TaxID=13333 RepID=W1NK79_AMBTC|nr:hypothetical protein AMTR_s00060p00189170 [Amborella trichopoda]